MEQAREADAEKRANLDFAGFAQEFLRRNPDYVQDYRFVDGLPPDEQEVMARRWGLCFPMPARCAARRCAGVVARYPIPGHRYYGCGSARIR